MPRSVENNCQNRILDAAEKAFADAGFAGASLRQITDAAKVNLATVYYYFKSKDGLMAEVVQRRLGPLKIEQLDLLRRFESASQGEPLPVEKVLEAMLLPPLRVATASSAKSRIIRRLIGRIVTEPNPKTQEMLRCGHQEARLAFAAAMQRSLPGLAEPELWWRLEFVWGALAFILCNPRKLEKETKGACNPVDTQKVLAEMTAFFSAGLRAAAPGKSN